MTILGFYMVMGLRVPIRGLSKYGPRFLIDIIGYVK